MGIKMRFERVLELAKATPTSVLCEAWGASPEYVNLCKIAAHHMTLQEAGDLAAAHGLELPDILGV